MTSPATALKWTRGLIFAFFVALPAGLSFWFGGRSLQLVMNGKQATATCTRIEKKTRRQNNSTYVALTWHVAFEDATGQSQQATVDASFTGLEPGGTIEILYDPDTPSRAEAATFFSLWGLAGMFGLMSLPGLWILWKICGRRQAARDV